jgi:hypothetical protein
LRSEGEDRGECWTSRPGSFILGPIERVGVGSRAGLETLLKREISRYCQESNVCDNYMRHIFSLVTRVLPDDGPYRAETCRRL